MRTLRGISRALTVALALAGPAYGLFNSTPSAAAESATPPRITAAAWSRVMAEIQAEQYTSQPDPHEPGSVLAANPRQRLGLRFTPTGVSLIPVPRLQLTNGERNPSGDASPTFQLRTRSVDGVSVPAVMPVAHDNRVEYRHSGYSEWYINAAAGLEQGWTLDAAPAGDTLSHISVEVVGARTVATGDAIDIEPMKGHVNYRYAALRAWDSTHRSLVTKMRVSRPGHIDITVDARGARYPITIDPRVTVHLEAELNDPATTVNDSFGFAVALQGDTLVVGASGLGNYSITSGLVGRAYIFVRNHQCGADAWSRVATLTDPTGGANEAFGVSVAVYDDTVVVGSLFAGNSGKAFIFGRNQGGAGNWGLVETLSDPGGISGDSFGQAVAVSGDTLVVGAPGQYGLALENAYVYSRNRRVADPWSLVATLAGPPYGFLEFGASVAVDGDTVVVGANEPLGYGYAQIYERNRGGAGNWGLVATLNDPPALYYDEFGAAVAIDGDTVVVGAPGNRLEGEPSMPGSGGKTYIYGRNYGGAGNWGLAATVSDPSATTGDAFGLSVALKGDTLVVGNSNEFQHGNAAYIFNRNRGGAGNWGLEASLSDPGANNADNFGVSVATGGDTVVVSADDAANYQGKVYVYQTIEGCLP